MHMVIGMTSESERSNFDKVYCELVNAARHKETINYTPIAEIMGLAKGKPLGMFFATRTGEMLGEICRYENKHCRPMLSAVVVRTDTKKPGPGFFVLARELINRDLSSQDDENAFWEQELEKVYNTWNR